LGLSLIRTLSSRTTLLDLELKADCSLLIQISPDCTSLSYSLLFADKPSEASKKLHMAGVIERVNSLALQSSGSTKNELQSALALPVYPLGPGIFETGTFNAPRIAATVALPSVTAWANASSSCDF
jgi:hypothetical protein